jgi:hypothetical protein
MVLLVEEDDALKDSLEIERRWRRTGHRPTVIAMDRNRGSAENRPSSARKWLTGGGR